MPRITSSPPTVRSPVTVTSPTEPASVTVKRVFVPSSKEMEPESKVIASANSDPSIVSSSSERVTVSVALAVAVKWPSVSMVSVSPLPIV